MVQDDHIGLDFVDVGERRIAELADERRRFRIAKGSAGGDAAGGEFPVPSDIKASCVGPARFDRMARAYDAVHLTKNDKK